MSQADWWTHYQMNFFLWACLNDGEDFLSSHRAFMDELSLPYSPEKHKRFAELQRRADLGKYHFVTSMGSMIRANQRARKLFPQLVPVLDRARHLNAEGKMLRDMIEHSDDYIIGGKPKHADKFVRQGPPSDFPGYEPGSADATSLYIDKRGHWLGGRLNVEWIMAEVREIYDVARNIPAPIVKPPSH